MRTRNLIGTGLVALILASVHPQLAQASEQNHLTKFTTSAPLEISGRILPAGTYTFTTLATDPNVVKIWNNDERKPVAFVYAIPEEATQTPTSPMLALSEAPMGAPEKIHAWFYPGDRIGWEFMNTPARMHGSMPAALQHRLTSAR